MSAAFDAWHLPGVAAGDYAVLRTGDLECRYPRPAPGLLDSAVRRLRAARRRLAGRPVDDIVAVIDAAASRFVDPADPLAAEAERLVGAAVGYSPAMTRLVIRRMAADWRTEPLRRLVRAELGEGAAGALDGFVRSEGRRTRAYGPRLAFHVFAGNVPGVAVTSLVRALLVKAPSFGKLAAGEPVLPVLFARALADVDPPLGEALVVTYWPGGSEEPERRMLQAADTAIVYGGEETVASLRRRAPARLRLLVHGPRFSVGVVAAAATAEPGTARDVALAAATFDQHGCVSPHAVFVEDPAGDLAPAFAEAVASAFAALEVELPRGRVSTADAAAVQQERGAAEMRGHAGQHVAVFAGAGTRWTVVHDPEPVFRPSCLNRFLHVHSLPRLEDCVDALAPVGQQLQSVALAGAGERTDSLADRLAQIGASRITTFPRLPWPPAHWHHDGRGPLRELLRWVDLEE